MDAHVIFARTGSGQHCGLTVNFVFDGRLAAQWYADNVASKSFIHEIQRLPVFDLEQVREIFERKDDGPYRVVAGKEECVEGTLCGAQQTFDSFVKTAIASGGRIDSVLLIDAKGNFVDTWGT